MCMSLLIKKIMEFTQNYNIPGIDFVSDFVKTTNFFLYHCGVRRIYRMLIFLDVIFIDFEVSLFFLFI